MQEVEIDCDLCLTALGSKCWEHLQADERWVDASLHPRKHCETKLGFEEKFVKGTRFAR